MREDDMREFEKAPILMIAGLLTWLGLAPAVAQQKPPLNLATTGWMYAGGKPDTAVEGSPMVGQMYVEYMIPQKQSHPYPIVMIHGGNQTGTNFTGTADGREGWAQYFVRRGYAVYVVDTVARGRSAHWSNALGKVQGSRAGFIEQRFVAPEKYNLWPQAKNHTQFPGTGQAGDAAFDNFQKSQMPSLADFTLQQKINRDAGVALLDKIGPAILLTHSQAGAFGWPIADARPQLVKGIVAVEPNGPPVKTVNNIGAPNWFTEGADSREFGITDVPLAYDPPLKDGEKLNFVKQDKPDAPDVVACWSQAAPARKLTNLATIPVLVLMSEASYHAAYDHCTVAYLKQAGVPVIYTKLAELGIKGNGHMMMMEKNSDAIAAVIQKWTDQLGKSKSATRRKR
jgi:pimeloyl-ACP methyl ester carboxylesterase